MRGKSGRLYDITHTFLIYVLCTFAVIAIQLVVGFYGAFAGIGCGSNLPGCSDLEHILALGLLGAPLFGSALVLIFTKSWSKALLYTLILYAVELPFLLTIF